MKGVALSDIYDDPAMQSSSGFFSWTNVPTGTKVSGAVVAVERGEDFNGGACPQYKLRQPNGDLITLTCGQANLKSQVVALRVQVGQHLTVTYTEDRKVAKGNMKVFSVEVTDPAAGPSPDDLA